MQTTERKAAREWKATVDDLYAVPENGKAELVDGRLVRMSPTGDRPGRAGMKIVLRLYEYEKQAREGRVYPDNVGFLVDLPDRKSFSPDAAFYVGPRAGGKFLQGSPVFAVEVRSEGDYGARAERAMTRKRADYFTAGTLVVWDVDVLRDEVVRVYRAREPERPVVYGRGEAAEAEPALPGWRMPVDEIMEV